MLTTQCRAWFWPVAATACLLAVTASPPTAADTAGDELLQEVQTRTEAILPEGWTARVRWREPDIAIFVMPPVAEGFNLAYQPEEELALVRTLCPAGDDPLWASLGPDRDIVVVPTVLGKGALRTSCRQLNEDAAAH